MVKILNKGFKTARSRYAFRLNRNPPPLPEPRPTQLRGPARRRRSPPHWSRPPRPPRASRRQHPFRRHMRHSIGPSRQACPPARGRRPPSGDPGRRLHLLDTGQAHSPHRPAAHSGPAGGGPGLGSVRPQGGGHHLPYCGSSAWMRSRPVPRAELVARHLPCVAVPNATGLEVAAGES